MFLLLFVLMQFSQGQDGTGGEILAKALISGDLKTMESLLTSGINPDLRDRMGQTPLYLALTFRNSPAAQMLLSWHADPNASLNSRNRLPLTPLQFAAQTGNLHLASMLIAAGARIDPAGRSPLQFAGRQLDMVRLLIEKGADVNARDSEGTSPLDDAVWTGSLDTAAILLAHGARLNEANPQTGATPINEAAFRGHTAVVRYLLQFHPDLSLPDKRGYSPLDNAIRMGKEESALPLLEAQLEGGQTSENIRKWTTDAIQKNAPLLLDQLLRKGSLPDGLLLETAALSGLDAIAKVLLDHGAPVNFVNKSSGTTALYAAASFGRGGVVKLLLERGANPNLCGKNGKSPYQAALSNGHNDVATLIQNHGGAKDCK